MSLDTRQTPVDPSQERQRDERGRFPKSSKTGLSSQLNLLVSEPSWSAWRTLAIAIQGHKRDDKLSKSEERSSFVEPQEGVTRLETERGSEKHRTLNKLSENFFDIDLYKKGNRTRNDPQGAQLRRFLHRLAEAVGKQERLRLL